MTEAEMLRGFSQRLVAARKKRGLSQHTLARKLLVDRSSIQKWELGMRYPQVYNVICLAKELDVSVQWLITGRSTKDERIA